MHGDIFRTTVEKPLRALAARCDDGYRVIIGSHTYAPIKDKSKVQPGTVVDFTGYVDVTLRGLAEGNYRIVLREIIQPGKQENKKFYYTSAEEQPEPAVDEVVAIGSEGHTVSFNWNDAKSGWYLDAIPAQ